VRGRFILRGEWGKGVVWDRMRVVLAVRRAMDMETVMDMKTAMDVETAMDTETAMVMHTDTISCVGCEVGMPNGSKDWQLDVE
jgi:hypothetical protein